MLTQCCTSVTVTHKQNAVDMNYTYLYSYNTWILLSADNIRLLDYFNAGPEELYTSYNNNKDKEFST